MYVCIYMYLCMYVCMYVCMHACMDGWMDGCMHVFVHVHVHTLGPPPLYYSAKLNLYMCSCMQHTCKWKNVFWQT